MKNKPVRLAVAALVTVLSVLGISQAGSVQGMTSARTTWCC
jgi:hypothetical protein